jgi:hypothetical protein
MLLSLEAAEYETAGGRAALSGTYFSRFQVSQHPTPYAKVL